VHNSGSNRSIVALINKINSNLIDSQFVGRLRNWGQANKVEKSECLVERLVVCSNLQHSRLFFYRRIGTLHKVRSSSECVDEEGNLAGISVSDLALDRAKGKTLSNVWCVILDYCIVSDNILDRSCGNVSEFDFVSETGISDLRWEVKCA